jgi:prephenate dehydrogenase
MRIAVIGTGLIGASVGLAAKRAGHTVAGYDPEEAALSVALERGAVDVAASLEGSLEIADLAVVAAPVAQLVHTVEAVLATSPDACSVTDVGSTKARVAAAAASPRFVGGHPVCGSEAHGPAHARADLFEGASWFLTPGPQTSAETHRLVHGFVSSLGATPVAVDPGVHDRLVALTSHLPHALANLLVNQAGAARIDGHEPLAAAAGGSLRDMTRVAGANPRIWVDIFLENSGAVRDALGEHRRRIEQLEQALGAERINIEDFELQHVSPERGGTLRLFISGEGEAERAARLLEEQGYGVELAPVVE